MVLVITIVEVAKCSIMRKHCCFSLKFKRVEIHVNLGLCYVYPFV